MKLRKPIKIESRWEDVTKPTGAITGQNNWYEKLINFVSISAPKRCFCHHFNHFFELFILKFKFQTGSPGTYIRTGSHIRWTIHWAPRPWPASRTTTKMERFTVSIPKAWKSLAKNWRSRLSRRKTIRMESSPGTDFKRRLPAWCVFYSFKILFESFVFSKQMFKNMTLNRKFKMF